MGTMEEGSAGEVAVGSGGRGEVWAVWYLDLGGGLGGEGTEGMERRRSWRSASAGWVAGEGSGGGGRSVWLRVVFTGPF